MNEIERKFLVNQLPSLKTIPFKMIRQAYISIEPVIRIRQADALYFLTIKSKGDVSHQEYEISITEAEFNRLLTKKEGIIIEKTRYFIALNDRLTAELDIFSGQLSNLITVEVEFPNIECSQSFVPPDWFGKDISYDPRYKNNHLAINGLP